MLFIPYACSICCTKMASKSYSSVINSKKKVKEQKVPNVKAPSSHLFASQTAFELFLFLCLGCGLINQKLNIYKLNFQAVDYDLVLFTFLLLTRRLLWGLFQETLQRHNYSEDPGGGNESNEADKKGTLQRSSQLLKYFIFLCLLVAMFWLLMQLIQKLSLFNCMFLFYPLLLYLSLFGFTMDPRLHRYRYQSTASFLHHLQMSTKFQPHEWEAHSSTTPSPVPVHINHSHTVSLVRRKGTLNGSIGSDNTSHSKQQRSGNLRLSCILLSATAHEVRTEVDTLVSDLVVRLKQLLFNSLLCAYYTGFIPMQFVDGSVFYNRWWCLEHAFFIWANSFIILSTHFLPPHYCGILYQCAQHLGNWSRYTSSGPASNWSPGIKWSPGAIVKWDGDTFKAEGDIQNVALPGNSSHEGFYLLFSSPSYVYTWLLSLEASVILFQVVVLIRSHYWHQCLAILVLLAFNYYVVFRLLANRWALRQLTSIG